MLGEFGGLPSLGSRWLSSILFARDTVKGTFSIRSVRIFLAVRSLGPRSSFSFFPKRDDISFSVHSAFFLSLSCVVFL